MHLARIGQPGHAVEFRRFEGHCGRVDDEVPVAVPLRELPAAHGVVLGVLDARGLGIGAFVGADLLKGWQQ